MLCLFWIGRSLKLQNETLAPTRASRCKETWPHTSTEFTTCILNKAQERLYHHVTYSRDKAVPCNDWLRAGRPRGRSLSPSRVKNFLFSTLSRPALGPTQPPIQRVPGALSLGIKQQGREGDCSPPASDELKKIRIYISTSPMPS
jgi:hypothetical protein